MQKFIFGSGNVEHVLIVTLKSGHKAAVVIKVLDKKARAAATAFWKKSIKAHEPFNQQLDAGLWRQVGDRWVPNCYSTAMADPDREPGFVLSGPVPGKKGLSAPEEGQWACPPAEKGNFLFSCECGYCTRIISLASCSCRWCGQEHSIMPQHELDRQWLHNAANRDALEILNQMDSYTMGWPEEPITEKLMSEMGWL